MDLIRFGGHLNECTMRSKEGAHAARQRSHHRGGVFAVEADEHDEARVTFDERRYVGVSGSREKVAFPMPRDGAILDSCRTFADRHGVNNLATRLSGRARVLRSAHRPTTPEMRDERFLEYSAALHEQA